MVIVMDISSDKHIKDFFIQRDISNQNTRTTYLLRLRKYCEFNNKTPTELILGAENEEDQRITKKNRQIRERLLYFKKQLQDQGQSYNSIKTSMATIVGFYQEFDIETPKIKLKNHETRKRTTSQDIVGKKHIKKALKKSNIKYTAIILLMSGSGMGSAEIRDLTYQNFLEAIVEYYEPTTNEQFDIPQIVEKLRKNNNLILTWNIYRHKTGHPYFTFSTPEANQALLDYLEDRYRENKPIQKKEDPIFLSGNTGIKRSSMMKYFSYLNDTCEFGYSGKSRFFTSHKLRKFFASTLTEHRMPYTYTRWLLGHNIDPTADAYIKPTIRAVKYDYTLIIPQLSIENVKSKAVTTKEYDYLLKDLQNEKQKREEMEQEREEDKKKQKDLERRVGIMEKLQANQEFQNDLSKD